jgi:hypothetical protein
VEASSLAAATARTLSHKIVATFSFDRWITIINLTYYHSSVFQARVKVLGLSVFGTAILDRDSARLFAH